MINKYISAWMDYGVKQNLIDPADKVYVLNHILELLQLDTYEEEPFEEMTLPEILEGMVSYGVSQGLLEDTGENRDLFDTKIMGLMTPPPSTVRNKFWNLYESDPKQATDWYYEFSQNTNYIRKDRIAKDVKWKTDTEFGVLDITINCSKPEKDPKDIARARTMKEKDHQYPKCLLCKENEGYAGHPGHPARQNHRVLPITLDGEPYYMQYSPYVYYNEHCIVFHEEHKPMVIAGETFRKLLDFVEQFPHYTIGSNADLPIVGGSILTHDHYQGGSYPFPMLAAPIQEAYTFKAYPEVQGGILKWPMSAIRLQSENRSALAELAEEILQTWRGYSDAACEILSETEGTPHNTITPIAGKNGDVYQLDLVLRNNRTTEEHPYGLFHPHEEYHYIKRENIGLIEVMGLAILPKRLIDELSVEKEEVREEIGQVFGKVLECAGVYKQDEKGRAGFHRFMSEIGAEVSQK